jgi:hypothetical protein
MSRDCLLVVKTDSVLPLPVAAVVQAIEQARVRLDCTVQFIDATQAADRAQALAPDSGLATDSGISLVSDAEERLRAAFQNCDLSPPSRVVLIPLGMSSIPIPILRAAWWFSGRGPTTQLHMANPISARTMGVWLAGGIPKGWDPNGRVEILGMSESDEATWERIAAVAFWASQSAGHPVTAASLSRTETNSIPVAGLARVFAHGGESGERQAVVYEAGEPRPWPWLASGPVASWLVASCLDALQSLPLPWSGDFDSAHADWEILHRLDREQQSMLPSEYAGELDAVSPRSMGSARLVYDANGLVPWDRIWTSFCDLAMAGGPPHRGRLLEAITAEEVARDRAAYAAVTAELCRGIQLATGLQAQVSDVDGWIAVRCQDERMAAWMMRAILVENILARREGDRLLLPAGPRFRVEKEIKNVITAVAKTHHYWQAHLRLRQPPKPL